MSALRTRKLVVDGLGWKVQRASVLMSVAALHTDVDRRTSEVRQRTKRLIGGWECETRECRAARQLVKRRIGFPRPRLSPVDDTGDWSSRLTATDHSAAASYRRCHSCSGRRTHSSIRPIDLCLVYFA